MGAILGSVWENQCRLALTEIQFLVCVPIPCYPSGIRSRERDNEQQINPSAVGDDDKLGFKSLH